MNPTGDMVHIDIHVCQTPSRSHRHWSFAHSFSYPSVSQAQTAVPPPRFSAHPPPKRPAPPGLGSQRKYPRRVELFYVRKPFKTDQVQGSYPTDDECCASDCGGKTLGHLSYLEAPRRQSSAEHDPVPVAFFVSVPVVPDGFLALVSASYPRSPGSQSAASGRLPGNARTPT